MFPASYDSDETLYGASAPKQKLHPGSAGAAPPPSESDSTLYGGSPTAQKKTARTTVSVTARPTDDATSYGAPAAAPIKRTLPAVPQAPSYEDDATVYGTPVAAPIKSTLPAVPQAPSYADDSTVYGTPAAPPTKCTLPPVPQAPSYEDDATVYSTPAAPPTKRTLPPVPQASSYEDDATVYGTPAAPPTKRTLPPVPQAPSYEDDATVYGTPAAPPTKRTLPAVPQAPSYADDATVYGTPAAPPTKRTLPAVPPISSPANEATVYGGKQDAPPNASTISDVTDYISGHKEFKGDNTASTNEQQPLESPSKESNPPLPKGSQIGKHKEYIVEKSLGNGGFGHTYLVRKDKIMHVVKECAPKNYSWRDDNSWIHPIEGAEKAFYLLRDYFSNEVDILNASKNKAKSIVYLVDEFDDNNTKYYTMAHLPGGSLDDLRKKKANFSEKELIKVLTDVLGALHALHSASIIHRDIKPKNIMLTEANDSVLIDFGSACFTWKRAKAIQAASPHWGPPEEFARDYTDHIGPHTDLYELGTTIYYLITGEAFHQPELVEKLKCLYALKDKPDTKDLQGLMAPYLECRRKEIKEMKAYSHGFREALCAALEPEIGKRLSSAQEWLNRLSEEKLKDEQAKTELHDIDEKIKANPEHIDEGMIDKLHQLTASLSSATLSLAKCYKHLWRKAVNEQMPMNAKKYQENYEKYLKEACEHKVRGAFREAANHLLLQHCGKMDEPCLKQACDLYSRDGLTLQEKSCKEALSIMQDYKQRALFLGFTGSHNMYLQSKQNAKECALLPQEDAQHIHAHLRGIAQLLCLLLSCGLCLPLIWLMALLEYKKVSKFISPKHLAYHKD